jgi:hypothetical protein
MSYGVGYPTLEEAADQAITELADKAAVRFQSHADSLATEGELLTALKSLPVKAGPLASAP